MKKGEIEMIKPLKLLIAVILTISFLALHPAHSSAAGNLKGDWVASFTIANQTVDGTLSLDVNGKTLTGTVFTVHTGQGTITDGTFENNRLSCTFKFENHESIAVTGEFKDDKLAGTFATEGSTGTWTAVRKK